VISPTVSALQKSIVAATFSTGGIAPYVNGTTYTLRSSSSNHPIPNLYIGSAYYYSAARQFWPGTVNEILVFSQSLTATQRQQIEGYLAAKWGLKGNLPTTHPFKVITP
jgi:hypothetical protein